MTAAELRKLQRAHERATARATQTGAARNAAVAQALAEGWTQRALADALSLSRGRISQIVATLARG